MSAHLEYYREELPCSVLRAMARRWPSLKHVVCRHHPALVDSAGVALAFLRQCRQLTDCRVTAFVPLRGARAAASVSRVLVGTAAKPAAAAAATATITASDEKRGGRGSGVDDDANDDDDDDDKTFAVESLTQLHTEATVAQLVRCVSRAPHVTHLRVSRLATPRGDGERDGQDGQDDGDGGGGDGQRSSPAGDDERQRLVLDKFARVFGAAVSLTISEADPRGDSGDHDGNDGAVGGDGRRETASVGDSDRDSRTHGDFSGTDPFETRAAVANNRSVAATAATAIDVATVGVAPAVTFLTIERGHDRWLLADVLAHFPNLTRLRLSAGADAIGVSHLAYAYLAARHYQAPWLEQIELVDLDGDVHAHGGAFERRAQPLCVAYRATLKSLRVEVASAQATTHTRLSENLLARAQETARYRPPLRLLPPPLEGLLRWPLSGSAVVDQRQKLVATKKPAPIVAAVAAEPALRVSIGKWTRPKRV
jgi:hypothetical protein